MTTPSALSPEQSPEQSRDGSPGPDAEQERAQEAAPARDEATSPAPVEVAVAEPVITERDTEPAAERTEAELRTMLGLGPVGAVMPLGVRARGWIVTGVVGVIAALLRLIGLNHPKTLMFDEIYYVKDAYSLWHLGYEATWNDKAVSIGSTDPTVTTDTAFAMGDFSRLTDTASYVVHPQLGKWLIGAGMEIFGPESPFGWRFMPAVAGILTVILLARLTMRLTRSPLLAGLAGLLLAIDGVALTESRIGLLDVFIGFFATLSLYCLVRDREWSRTRLARRMAGTTPGARAPHATIRPWLLAAGIALGLTCSIKWSGLYLVAVCGITVVIWDTLALRRVRARAWFLEGTVAQGVSDFLQAIPVVIVVYIGCWWSWFTHLGAFKHGWTAEQVKAQVPQTCGGGDCIQAITSIGNIVIWWSAVVALVAVVIIGVKNRDWRAWVPLIGYLGLYVPWFQYRDRTIFTFYTVAFVPCVVLVLVLALGMASGLLPPLPGSASADTQMEALLRRQIGPDIRPWRGMGARFLGFGPQFARTPVWTPPVEETEPGIYRINPALVDVDDDLEPGVPFSDPRTDAALARSYDELTGYPAPSTSEDAIKPAWSDGGVPRLAGRRSPWASLAKWTMAPTWQIRTEGIGLIIVVTLLACAAAAFWWPIWTGQTVSRSFWVSHMFLSSWI